MQLFVVGDFHADPALRDAFHEEVNGADDDLVLLIGDYEDPDYYEDLIGGIEETQVLALTGNWDFGFEPPENGEYTRLFNYQEVEFHDYHLVLLGSVYPDTFMEDIAAFFDGVDNRHRIIASHYPPHMLGDLARTGNRAGFPEFRDLIMKEKPALWCCGHIHEDYGEFSLLDTTVLNAAAQESGKGWRVTLGDDGVEDAEEVVLLDRD